MKIYMSILNYVYVNTYIHTAIGKLRVKAPGRALVRGQTM